MSEFIIHGGKSLNGGFRIQGSKNAVLPIMAASLLIRGAVELSNVPDITDVSDMCDILETLGCTCVRNNHDLIIDAGNASPRNIEANLTEKMRSSVFILGPLLARFGEANLYMPGGCAIGKRPVDLHLAGLRSLGAVIHENGDRISALSMGLRGCRICLSYPSVGATENILMAACASSGFTIIKGCAREPEIVELCLFLVKCGAEITGIGSSTLLIRGKDYQELKPCRYTVGGDRIASATYLYACAACGGSVTVEGIYPAYLTQVLKHISDMGYVVREYDTAVTVKAAGRPRPVDIVTGPYPSFPTDLQPIAMAVLTRARGEVSITEKVFEDRFKTAGELEKLGARLKAADGSVIITGIDYLNGTSVTAGDLRGGAALMIAGLIADGETRLSGTAYIDRGYEAPESVFTELGADIWRN